MQLNNDTAGIDVMVGYYPESQIKRYRTICCALGQLGLSSGDNFEEISEVIEEIKMESQRPINSMRRNGAERAIFVITIKDEESILESNLEKAGFKMIYEFHSRAYNPETRMLRMWIISW